ncbi:hypothetical protein [Nitriliruptor alkaliphilus]|uniref:hypothetical protein n=1 Tax=Nitriliruptor alkaliphilus TaxID=427918 RepID=UPI00069824C9|nr:hypothetical protein [Nitriliruptor alkaliphilus]
MTRNESFKRRIRARMAETGERYGAARRVLIERAARQAEDGATTRTWVADPEHSDAAIEEATGRTWDTWCDLLDDRLGDDTSHGAIVDVVQEHGTDGWWAQAVTVGYERITGLRLPFQRPDGTFTASKSRTVTVDAEMLRDLLLDDDGRAALFPGVDTELRSRPTSKNVRLRVGPGTAEISMTPRDEARVAITVAHEKLPDAADVDHWKSFWDEWLAAVDAA